MSKQLMVWSEILETGFKEIDEQHKKLVEIMNKLFKAYSENDHKKTLKTILNELSDYSRYHFRTEELYFDQFNYINKAEHINEHNKFMNSINDIQKKFSSLEGVFSLKLLIFLQEWVTNHILASDKKYIDCFKNGGLQ